jgi:hypothetical protein
MRHNLGIVCFRHHLEVTPSKYEPERKRALKIQEWLESSLKGGLLIRASLPKRVHASLDRMTRLMRRQTSATASPKRLVSHSEGGYTGYE